jgi:hypothetical protein
VPLHEALFLWTKIEYHCVTLNRYEEETSDWEQTGTVGPVLSTGWNHQGLLSS